MSLRFNKLTFSILASIRNTKNASFICHHGEIKHILNQKSVFQICRSQSQSCNKQDNSVDSYGNKKNFIAEGPSLKEFIMKNDKDSDPVSSSPSNHAPYLNKHDYSGNNRKVYFETYGCQMNVSDTEIAWSVLKDNQFLRAETLNEADVVLIMTCAIREGAEDKIWRRLQYLKHLKKRRQQKRIATPLKIGILGCMAERLKAQIVEREKSVDLVCGPDAYRDLPRMLAITQSDQTAVNVLLSLDETYADIVPVRINQDSKTAFVSIMRGCDNMCSYCIVPFTRGRERSRPITSILDEVRALSDQGVREITLLGQNVNSYRDMSVKTSHGTDSATRLSAGFRTLYKPKHGGLRFADLLDKVSLVDPEMRIRFTSPHPKDFPDEVLELMRDRPNICKQIHLPAQSGNNEVLAAMRRGYTREAYLDLVQHIRETIPGVALTSDFISGFCGETEKAHQETLDLIHRVQYTFAFCFPYSMRQKTRAFHHLIDDVPDEVKSRRHMELVTAFRQGAERLNTTLIGSQQLVLVEGVSRRSNHELAGRNDAHTRVVLSNTELPASRYSAELVPISPGDYVVVQILSATSQALKGVPLYHSTIQDFHSDPTQEGVHAVIV